MTQLFPLPPPSAAQPDRPPPYRLAALLRGHTQDVRAVATAPSSPPRLFTASRDGSARSWRPPSASDSTWTQERAWQDGHEGYINALAWVPASPDSGSPHGYLATAGTDSIIQIYSLEPAAPPAPLSTLLGHAHNVCALHCSADGLRIASASWDCTARIWQRQIDGKGEGQSSGAEWSCTRVLVDHGAAVWDVMLLDQEKDAVLTACADSHLRLFSGSSVRHVFKGHQGPVRALAKLLPDDPACALFASASNDGTVRVWDYRTGDALTVLGTHDSFIYSLATIPSTAGGGLASSGEDGIISIWNEQDGEKDQEVRVPALSVWSLATLPNGDLACGCSDNMTWIFTRDPMRVADRSTQEEYDRRLEQLGTTHKPQSAQPVVHEPAALEEPGSQTGDVRLVRRGDGVVAYQWQETQWKELGEVVSPPEAEAGSVTTSQPREKTLHNGQSYDYVLDVDVKDDEPPLKLPYNLNDDPHAVAVEFVAQHSLPESYLEQIVQFIRAATA